MTTTLNNAESEVTVLAAALTRPKEWAKVREILQPDDFWHEPFRWLWQAMQTLDRQGIGVDLVTAADQLGRMGKLDQFTTHDNHKQGMVALTWMTDALGNTKNAESHAVIVRDYAVKRRLVEYAQEIATMAHNGKTAHEVIERAQGGLSLVESALGGKTSVMTSRDVLTASYDYSVDVASGKIPAYGTGFAGLDEMTDGGLRGGQLIIPAGRPGTGKTAFKLSMFMHDILSDFRPAFFGLEMTPREQMNRIISAHSGIPLSLIKRGRMSDNQWQQYAASMAAFEDRIFWMVDEPGLSIPSLKNHLRRLVAAGCKKVYIDYLQLMTVTGKYDNRVQEVSYISRELKITARTFDVPIVASAQLSREVEKRNSNEPRLSDLRESGSLEQDADIVIMLWADDDAPNTNVIHGKIAKQREGPIGKFDLLFDRSIQKMSGAMERKVSV